MESCIIPTYDPEGHIEYKVVKNACKKHGNRVWQKQAILKVISSTQYWRTPVKNTEIVYDRNRQSWKSYRVQSTEERLEKTRKSCMTETGNPESHIEYKVLKNASKKHRNRVWQKQAILKVISSTKYWRTPRKNSEIVYDRNIQSWKSYRVQSPVERLGKNMESCIIPTYDPEGHIEYKVMKNSSRKHGISYDENLQSCKPYRVRSPEERLVKPQILGYNDLCPEFWCSTGGGAAGVPH
jgi:hypothetical protein